MVSLPASDSAVWLVLASLAVWRITALLCYEAGPFDLFVRLRRLLARVGLGKVVTCFHCTALWVSAVLVAVVFERRLLSLLVVLAGAGSASIVERWLGGDASRSSEESDDV